MNHKITRRNAVTCHDLIFAIGEKATERARYLWLLHGLDLELRRRGGKGEDDVVLGLGLVCNLERDSDH